MKKHELIWLAGLLEGEGTFRFSGTVVIVVEMTDLDIVQRVAKLFGNTSINSRQRYHWKRLYVTAVCGKSAAKIAELVLPIMGKRRSVRIKHILKLASERPGQSVGIRYPHSKLTPRKVRTIRSLRQSGMSTRAIAKRFEVTHGAINHIIAGRNWRHICQ